MTETTARRHQSARTPLTLGSLALLWLVATSPAGHAQSGQIIELSFAPQTGFERVRFAGREGETIAIAGRDDDGAPRLALITLDDGRIAKRELALPDDAVAIDTGANGDEGESLFILGAQRVLRLDRLDAEPISVAAVASLYRGRSYAPLTAAVDLARDVDGDGRAELLIQDFDLLTVLDGERYERRHVLELPTLRRSFERAQNFRPVRLAHVDGGDPLLVSVRGDALLRFDIASAGDADSVLTAKTRALNLGLSSERDIERFYNGDTELDQSNVTLREPEILTDVNGDGRPDLVTLETVSSGVFDKQTTFKLHLARDPFAYSETPDAQFSSDGYQFGLRSADLGGDRVALVAPSVRIGLRTIISALFSRSVTLNVAIFSAGADGQFGDEPSAEVRAKVRFDFGSGQVEYPTVTFGDIDGDGLRDLVLKRGRRELGWRRNLGEGRFDRKDQPLDIEAPKDGSNVVAADLDGDGVDEVLVRYGLQDGAERKRQLRLLDLAPAGDD